MASRFYLDTNVFIGAFEGVDEAASTAQDVLETLERYPDVGVTSELTLAELLVPQNPDLKELVFRRLISGGTTTLRAITRDILIRSAEFRRGPPRRKLPDAIQVATAIETGCSYMVSFDKGMNRVPPPLVWVKPDAAGIVVLKQALA